MLKGTQTNGRSIALHVALLSELLRHMGTGQLRPDLFTVTCLVIWPLNESEAGIDLYRSYINDVALMLINWNLRKKSSEISTKTRSVPASLSFIGQVTEHIIVKAIMNESYILKTTGIIAFLETRLFLLTLENFCRVSDLWRHKILSLFSLDK